MCPNGTPLDGPPCIVAIRFIVTDRGKVVVRGIRLDPSGTVSVAPFCRLSPGDPAAEVGLKHISTSDLSDGMDRTYEKMPSN